MSSRAGKGSKARAGAGRDGTAVPPPRGRGSVAHDAARPARRGGRDRAGVSEIQRARILAAMSELVFERSAGGVTVADVVARSGVSRRTFYELFEDREGCFLAAFDLAVRRGCESVIPAYEAGRSWRERVAGGLQAVLAFLDAEPALGYLCVVGALGAGPRALERRARVITRAGRGGARGAPRDAGGAPTGPLGRRRGRRSGARDRSLAHGGAQHQAAAGTAELADGGRGAAVPRHRRGAARARAPGSAAAPSRARPARPAARPGHAPDLSHGAWCSRRSPRIRAPATAASRPRRASPIRARSRSCSRACRRSG